MARSRRGIIVQGKALELVVAWIQKSLHRNAVVAHNDSITDRDTGEPRQIDVSIRVPSGKEEFLAIVEVRDRKAKVDATYVEQVLSKRVSVGADAAFIVSRSGFTVPAIKKAGLHGIRTFTLDEASDADWGRWMRSRTFGVRERKFAASRVILAKRGTMLPIDLSEASLAALRADPTVKLVLTTGGEPHAGLPDLISTVVNHFTGNGLAEAPEDGSRVGHSMVFNGTWDPPLFVESATGELVEVGAVRVDAVLWWDDTEFPAKLRRYRKTTTKGLVSHVEIVEADTVIGGRRVTFQLLAETDGSCIRGGSVLSVRHVVVDDDPTSPA